MSTSVTIQKNPNMRQILMATTIIVVMMSAWLSHDLIAGIYLNYSKFGEYFKDNSISYDYSVSGPWHKTLASLKCDELKSLTINSNFFNKILFGWDSDMESDTVIHVFYLTQTHTLVVQKDQRTECGLQ